MEVCGRRRETEQCRYIVPMMSDDVGGCYEEGIVVVGDRSERIVVEIPFFSIIHSARAAVYKSARVSSVQILLPPTVPSSALFPIAFRHLTSISANHNILLSEPSPDLSRLPCSVQPGVFLSR